LPGDFGRVFPWTVTYIMSSRVTFSFIEYEVTMKGWLSAEGTV
jgi:hypothetical protein